MRPLHYIRKHVFGLSQASFADAIGVNQSTVSRWEAGTLEPSREEMARIRDRAAAMNHEWSDILFFEVPATASEAAA